MNHFVLLKKNKTKKKNTHSVHNFLFRFSSDLKNAWTVTYIQFCKLIIHWAFVITFCNYDKLLCGHYIALVFFGSKAATLEAFWFFFKLIPWIDTVLGNWSAGPVILIPLGPVFRFHQMLECHFLLKIKMKAPCPCHKTDTLGI